MKAMDLKEPKESREATGETRKTRLKERLPSLVGEKRNASFTSTFVTVAIHIYLFTVFGYIKNKKLNKRLFCK